MASYGHTSWKHRFTRTSFDADEWNILTRMTCLGPTMQVHLVRVYQYLALTLGCASLGCIFHSYFGIFQNAYVSFGCSLFCFLALALIEPTPNSAFHRTLLLVLFGCFQGLSIHSLVETIISIDPLLMVTALVGTTLIFGCFSLSALLSRRRSWIYLNGFLFSALSVSFWLYLMNFFLLSDTLATIQMYLSCLIASLFIMYDTQLMVERTTRGERDAIWQALQLFLDAMQLFVRLILILQTHYQKKQEEKDRKNRKK
jgi:FtsH-binding integral membrane protein